MTDTPTAPAPSPAPVHVRGQILPDGEVGELWIHHGRITHHPVPGARTVGAEGWILPALVDAHLHVGITEVGAPLDPEALDADLAALARAGISAARILGSPQRLPEEALSRPGGPLLLTAGTPVAAPGRFFPGWGIEATGAELADACVEQARGGWSKIIADWFDEDGGYGPSFTRGELTAAVAAVHAAGGRVAVHAQSAAGGADAAAAGADSIEHGMHLPETSLDVLAANDALLVPTGSVFEQMASSMDSPEVPETLQRWFTDGLASHPDLVRAARVRGVRVLAGTDQPVGALVDEIRWLHETGMRPHEAVGAATWSAREWFDLPRLREGDRADLLVLEHDPREDLERLRAPDLVVIDGRIIG